MDTAQWPQGSTIGVVKPMESSSSGPMVEKKARPQKDQILNCPRCNSTNTKFCYYNNYSLSQPRYFCKTCRRYWTEGGSLRNVPVGGGSRKNKRSAPSSSASSPPSKKIPDLISQSFPTQNPRSTHEEGMQDLNLAYPTSTDHQHDLNSISKLVEVPFNTTDNSKGQQSQYINSSVTSSSSHHLSALDILKTGGIGTTSRGLSSFMAMPVSDSNTLYSAGFPMQEFKPSLNFSLDGFEGEYGSFQGVQERARMLFPVGGLKQDPASREGDEQNREQGDSNGFWNGILGGGSW